MNEVPLKDVSDVIDEAQQMEKQELWRQALMYVNKELLISALHLPADVEILDVNPSFDRADCIVFKIRSKGFAKTSPGQSIPTVYPQYKEEYIVKKVTFEGWH